MSKRYKLKIKTVHDIKFEKCLTRVIFAFRHPLVGLMWPLIAIIVSVPIKVYYHNNRVSLLLTIGLLILLCHMIIGWHIYRPCIPIIEPNRGLGKLRVSKEIDYVCIQEIDNLLNEYDPKTRLSLHHFLEASIQKMDFSSGSLITLGITAFSTFSMAAISIIVVLNSTATQTNALKIDSLTVIFTFWAIVVTVMIALNTDSTKRSFMSLLVNLIDEPIKNSSDTERFIKEPIFKRSKT